MADEIVYAATGHPQDPQKRRPTLHTPRLSADGSSLTALQSVSLPEGSAMPMFQALPSACNTLYTVAGPLGVLAYKIDPQTGALLPPSAYGSGVIEPSGSYSTDIPVGETATIEGQPADSVPGGAGACVSPPARSVVACDLRVYLDGLLVVAAHHDGREGRRIGT